tara:strand:+ start:437 stop:1246 length:810 start_codon:yes stop_codon:yes gene_type:complete
MNIAKNRLKTKTLISLDCNGIESMEVEFPVKGAILAGGEGSRLLPFTKYTHKTLLPVNDRPVIDYALKTMRESGVADITIVGNHHVGQIEQHVGIGNPGENIRYVTEEVALGVGNALQLIRPIVEGSRILLYFSDNITTWDFTQDVEKFMRSEELPGCVMLAREVNDPSSFGICEFDEMGNIVDIEEKPISPKSNMAIGGIYLFDESFWIKFDKVTPPDREDFSISEVTRQYVLEGKASIHNLGKDTWIDCGSPSSLLDASILAREGRI